MLITLAAWMVGFFVAAPPDHHPCTLHRGPPDCFTGGSNSGLMALAANSYPVAIRSTGIGACYSLGGRTGAPVRA